MMVYGMQIPALGRLVTGLQSLPYKSVTVVKSLIMNSLAEHAIRHNII